MFSSIDTTFCFSVAYTISVSCITCSNPITSSITSSCDFSYSSFCCSNSSIFLFNFLISFSSSCIWLVLPIMLFVFTVVDPPVIAPLGLITSPFSVTILNEYLFCLASIIAVSMLSTITVLPSKFNIISSYFLSTFTKSAAIPITPPKLFFISLSTLFPFTEAIGKKEALPKLFFLKCSISFLASSSVSVTMF